MKTELYVIHGWTYKTAAWEEVVESLKKLGLNAKLLKVPGLGTASKKVWTIQDYVDWANREIPDNAIALGHSNGGRILLNMLAQNPEKLSGVILLDAAGIYEKSRKRTLMEAAAKTFAPLKKIPLLRKIFHRLIGANDYENAPENMKKTLHNMLESHKVLELSKITTKAQIIWGEDDKITPLRQGKKMHELLKNSQLIIKRGWGHSPYFEHKDALARQIMKSYELLSNGEKS